MKRIFIALLFLPFFCGAQKDSTISYSEVVKVDSVSKEGLFIKARDWYNTTFNSSKDVLQIQDKENGQLSGKGTVETECEMHYLGKQVMTAWSKFSINIWVKDGRYKYSISDIENTSVKEDDWGNFGILTTSDFPSGKIFGQTKRTNQELYTSYKSRILTEMQNIIVSLKAAMSQKQSPSEF